MNEIANTQQTGLTPIAVLAEEARIYSESMAMNMLNLGRVFTEAKKQVAHGEWGDWVQRYSGMSARSAQQLMAIYSRFGDKPAFAGVEKSKMYKMLALPEGTEEAFAEKNDLSVMTSREVEEAVKRVREQANEEIRRERAARKAAEERAEELSARPPEVPEEVSAALKSKDAMIEQQKQELERIAATGRDSVAEANRLRSDNNRLRRELNENAELLEETQQECNRAQAELLNLQSTDAIAGKHVLSDEVSELLDRPRILDFTLKKQLSRPGANSVIHIAHLLGRNRRVQPDLALQCLQSVVLHLLRARKLFKGFCIVLK